MAFCRTADRRIARHQRHIIQRQRRQQRLAAQAGSSQRCLHASVAGANDNYIKCICNITHLNRPLKNICISERTPKFFIAERYVNCDAIRHLPQGAGKKVHRTQLAESSNEQLIYRLHNPQSSPTAMPAPLQGAYRKLEFQYIIISSLKGKVAASFSEQTEGLRRFPLLTDTEPLKNLIDNLILHRITRNLP